MAELTPKERLQPSLLDRLADDEPGVREEGRDRRVLSLPQIRQSVRRDLEWLLNTDCLASTEDLAGFPEVAASVLNYGVPDMAGATLSSIDARGLEQRLLQSISLFEPRILRESVKVRMALSEQSVAGNAAAFEIEGTLWAQPLPERLFLRTKVDLETGNFSLERESS